MLLLVLYLLPVVTTTIIRKQIDGVDIKILDEDSTKNILVFHIQRPHFHPQSAIQILDYSPTLIDGQNFEKLLQELVNGTTVLDQQFMSLEDGGDQFHSMDEECTFQDCKDYCAQRKGRIPEKAIHLQEIG